MACVSFGKLHHIFEAIPYIEHVFVDFDKLYKNTTTIIHIQLFSNIKGSMFAIIITTFENLKYFWRLNIQLFVFISCLDECGKDGYVIDGLPHFHVGGRGMLQVGRGMLQLGRVCYR